VPKSNQISFRDTVELSAAESGSPVKREEFYREESSNLDSLTDLKERGIVRPEFIDELTSRHVEVHADYYGTIVWILMMLEQWFGQHGAAARAGHPSALGHSSSVQAN
jgi:hypothetical protein